MTTKATEQKTEVLTLPEKIHEISKQMDSQVAAVIGDATLQGFERFFLVAQAAGELKKCLSDDYMKPIMELQGNRLGFKCDKVYDVSTVRNCIIEAVLMGVQPVGNQFNIIAGNTYITKEGFGYLLSKIPGLYYDITPELPRIKDQSAAVVMNINWKINGNSYEKKVDFAIKVNQYMGTDAVIGKATRKSRAWLYNTITGSEIPEGDESDMIQVRGRVVASEDTNEVLKRFTIACYAANDEESLQKVWDSLGEDLKQDPAYRDQYELNSDRIFNQNSNDSK